VTGSRNFRLISLFSRRCSFVDSQSMSSYERLWATFRASWAMLRNNICLASGTSSTYSLNCAGARIGYRERSCNSRYALSPLFESNTKMARKTVPFRRSPISFAGNQRV
jgi:hypothetical protein